jgi:hypothetical protein
MLFDDHPTLVAALRARERDGRGAVGAPPAAAGEPEGDCGRRAA